MHIYNYGDANSPSSLYHMGNNTDACIHTRLSTWALCFKYLKTVRRGLPYFIELSLYRQTLSLLD